MGTTKATLTYAKSEFTGSTGNPNMGIFTREVSELPLTAHPDAIYAAGTGVVLQWDNTSPVAADVTVIEAAVLAHVGGATSANLVQESSEEVSTNATGTWEYKLSLTTGLLVGGTYEMVWHAEVAQYRYRSSTSAEAEVLINGSSETVFETSVCDWQPIGGYKFVDVQDGDTVSLSVRYRKNGKSANMAKIQKVRLAVKPHTD